MAKLWDAGGVLRMRLLIPNRKDLANTEPRWYFVGSVRQGHQFFGTVGKVTHFHFRRMNMVIEAKRQMEKQIWGYRIMIFILLLW